MTVDSPRDVLSRNEFALQEVLRACDDIAKKNRQHGNESEVKKDRTTAHKRAKAWKRAFVKEFDGLSLEDFQWKNL